MPSDRRYLIEFFSCLAAYAALLVLTILLLGPNRRPADQHRCPHH